MRKPLNELTALLLSSQGTYFQRRSGLREFILDQRYISILVYDDIYHVHCLILDTSRNIWSFSIRKVLIKSVTGSIDLLKVIFNSITAEYVLWINYLAPALSPLISYPDVITIADSPKISDTDDDTVADACIHVHADADQHGCHHNCATRSGYLPISNLDLSLLLLN